MRILSATQIREADAFTIHNEPISSIDLMERASRAFVSWFIEKFDVNRQIVVFSGPGNNGGDGLAISRLLVEKGYTAQVNIVREKPSGSRDFLINLDRIKSALPVNEINNATNIPLLQNSDIVIDALFGSGLDRPVEGLFAEVIKAVNQSDATVVAVDIPSGLFSDKKSEGENIVQADYTVSFQVAKLAFFMRQNHSFVGEWHVVGIGLDDDFIDSLDSPYSTIEPELAIKGLPKRTKFSHKGNFGRTIIFAGSRGKMGAAVLCSRACLRSGIGLLTVHVPECGYQIVQMAVPEAMVTVDPSEDIFTDLPDLELFDSMGMGPGLGTNEKTLKAVRKLLQKAEFPVVMDADAINLLGMDKSLMELIPRNSILTPHPKEFERIAGETDDDFERLNLQRKLAKDHQIYIVLKGAHSSVATPEGKIFFNTTGNPGMATAGSGDVLTGITTALLAQSKDPFLAATSAVYLHGLAGDFASSDMGEESLIASDIIDHIPGAIKMLRENFMSGSSSTPGH